MPKLRIPRPISGGLFLTYKCNSECRHCMYACSPQWKADWMSLSDAEKVLAQLSKVFTKRYPPKFNEVGVNMGLHFTGGEPFLNFNLLLDLVKVADNLEMPGTFVETNCFWCIDDETTEEKFQKLKTAGLKGVLISANPFVVEQVPFERTERAVKISKRIFGANTMVYQDLFYRQMKMLGVRSTLSFEEYSRLMEHKDPIGLRLGLGFYSILPLGRATFRLGHLYKKHPAQYFFDESCMEELTRDWHIHVDNYCNYMTGYCGGISLGDARNLDAICQGIELDECPLIGRLISPKGLMKLFSFAVEEFGYKERQDGYVSKCHLCIDIRKHISEQTSEFRELKPKAFCSRL